MNIREKKDAVISYVAGMFRGGGKDFQFLLNIAIIILINIAAVTLNVRFDLTRNGTYSLSDKSRDVVNNLNEKLTVRVLFSKDLPAEHKSLYRYLVDLLDEYDYYGNRYFSYSIVGEDDLEKEASDFGIRPVKSREYVNDQVTYRSTYMGLVIQQADLVEKVQSITSPAGLEYQITSLIMKMSGKIDGLLGLKDPVQLNLYLDSNLKNLPIDGINNLEKAVSDAVEKTNVNNYGKMHLNVIDTSKDENKKDLAGIYGLKKLKWGGGATASGKAMKAGEGYLGIVMEIPGKFSVIELNVMPTLFGNYVISGIDGLEDRINDAIGTLVSTNPRVGYVTGHREPGIRDEQTREGAGLLNKILSDVYTVRELDLSKDDIPGDIGTLIINGPKSGFSDYELYKIDQFLMKGRAAIFFIDSFEEVNMGRQQNFYGQQEPVVLPVNTNLEKLLSHYGITVNRDIVLDKNSAKVNMGNMIRDYPLVPIITDKGLDDGSVITKYLKGAVFIKTSSVVTDSEKLKKEGVIAVNLVSSSDESWLMTGRMNFNPFMMDAGDDKDFKSYPIACLVSGPFDSFFKDQPVPVNDKDAGKGQRASMVSAQKLDRTVQSAKSSIIVVGTSEITRSGFLLDSRRIITSDMGGEDDVFSNAVLLHNMVDFMAGNYHIPEMKSKSLEYNPLVKTGDRERFIYKAVNVAGLPFFVVIAGLLVWQHRSRRRRSLQQLFSKEESHE
ncbi:MAG TPA: Gldg family protein [Spirochaetota bacterium]|nr:Gldg family protein [Spirochaetota bacterium]HPI91297.1 Gldg family protein [Spirochaetota bacterium]HPR48193.1 Gldg family protein [Spirochaetota bacterium]